MNTTNLSAFPILIQAALADVQFKVMEGIWQKGTKHLFMEKSQLDAALYPSEKWGTTEEHRFDRNHPYLQACDEARELCVELGRYCRVNGFDPCASPLVDNLHFKGFFFDAFEKGREVICSELTPFAIHEAVEKKNVLRWEGWTVTAGPQDFSTDDYGLDQYIQPLIAKHESGEHALSLWMAGHPKDRAREAYRRITGSAFAGDDTLGIDDRHWCEPSICEFDDAQSDDDSLGLEELYELSDDDQVDLMEMSAKLEIEEMCNVALQRIASDS